MRQYLSDLQLQMEENERIDAMKASPADVSEHSSGENARKERLERIREKKLQQLRYEEGTFSAK